METPDKFNNASLIFSNLSATDAVQNSFKNVIRIIVPILFATILIIGFIGNSMVIVAIIFNREMQNSTFLLIGNLAIADLIFLVFCIPYQAINYALTLWPFLHIWCSIVGYLQNVAIFVSVWTLVVIAFDRYLAIIFPVQSIRYRTTKISCFCTIALWTIIMVANIPILKEFQVLEYLDRHNRTVSACVFIGLISAKASAIYIQIYCVLWIIFAYILPLSITLVLYLCVLHKLWNKVSKNHIRLSKDYAETARRVTVIVVTVTLTFSVCWLPLHLCYIFRTVNYKQRESKKFSNEYLIIEIVSKVLAFANSCANPFLYSFLCKNFRRGFYDLWQYFKVTKNISKRKTTVHKTIDGSEMITSRMLTKHENGDHQTLNYSDSISLQ